MEALKIAALLVTGLAGLSVGAEFLVRGSSRFALSGGIKPLIIGLTLVAYGTSTPELVVSLDAGLRGDSGISVGNVVGSNICNVGLILGATALIKPINISKDLFRRDIPAMIIISLLLPLLAWLGGTTTYQGQDAYVLQRWAGVVFLGLVIVVQWLMFRSARGAQEETAPEATKVGWGKRAGMLGLALFGLVVLLVGGRLFVDGAVTLAEKLDIPSLIIGLTIVAVGTSMPELFTSIFAAFKGESDISAGNVVGSNIFNIALILGLVAVISPVPVQKQVVLLDIPVMIGLALLFPSLAAFGGRLSRPAGGVLLSVYGLYVLNLIFGWVSAG